MSTTRRRPIVLATLTALLLAACGTGTAPSRPGGAGATSGTPTTQAPGGGVATQPPDATVDACALLTAADIEAVTGLVTKTSVPGPQGGIFASGCLWELVDDAMVPPSISFGVMKSGGRDYYDRYFAGLGDPGYEPIDGLGDVAVDAEFGAVLVVSGDTFFQVQYLGGGFGGDDTAVATELSRKVIANLGR